MLENLRLPEEDSVSFKDGLTPGLHAGAGDGAAGAVDIVVPDLPHLSNATDLDALRCEPGVRLRVVRHGKPHSGFFQRLRGLAVSGTTRLFTAPAYGAVAARP